MRVTGDGLWLDGRTVPLRSGAIAHGRIAPAHWPSALDAARELGLTLVEACLPWSLHEVAAGDFDFGTSDPGRDVNRFLDLAHERGLFVFLRPGPFLGIEFDHMGLPARITDDDANLARTESGSRIASIAPPRMSAVPSLGSRAFRREVCRWFTAVARTVADRVWPAGPIVLTHVDLGDSVFARAAATTSDHHEDTIEAYRTFLRQRHGSLARLREAHGVEVTEWAEVRPPAHAPVTTRSHARVRLDWIAFEEHLTDDAFATFRAALCTGPLATVPVVRAIAPDAAEFRAEGDAGSSLLVGFEIPHDRRDPATVRRHVLRLSGSTSFAFSPRVDVATPPWSAPRSDADHLHALLTACAAGLRGFHLTGLVDRGRLIGAPLDPSGRPRAAADAWRRVLAALDAADYHTLHTRPRVAIQRPPEYTRLAHALHGLGPLGPAWLDALGLPPGAGAWQARLDLSDAIPLAWDEWSTRVERALSAAGVPFVFVDEAPDATAQSSLDPQREPCALFVPSFEFAAPQRWQAARAFAAAGGAVHWGPRHPTLDPDFRLAEHAPLPGAPLVLDDDAAASVAVAALVRALGLEEPYAVTPAPIELAVHHDAHGPRAIFLVHPGRADLPARLRAVPPAPGVLRDVVTGECFDVAAGAPIPMRARSCRLLVPRGHGQ